MNIQKLFLIMGFLFLISSISALNLPGFCPENYGDNFCISSDLSHYYKCSSSSSVSGRAYSCPVGTSCLDGRCVNAGEVVIEPLIPGVVDGTEVYELRSWFERFTYFFRNIFNFGTASFEQVYPNGDTCYDSDGLDYNTAGQVVTVLSGYSFIDYDYCVNPNQVVEYSCNADPDSVLYVQTSDCSNGCLDGRCLPDDSSPVEQCSQLGGNCGDWCGWECCEGLVCDGFSCVEAPTGDDVVLAQEGETCGIRSDRSPYCDYGLDCEYFQCVKKSVLGEPCNYESDCDDGDSPEISCYNGICTYGAPDNPSAKYCADLGGTLIDADSYWFCRGDLVDSLEVVRGEGGNVACCIGETDFDFDGYREEHSSFWKDLDEFIENPLDCIRDSELYSDSINLLYWGGLVMLIVGALILLKYFGVI